GPDDERPHDRARSPPPREAGLRRRAPPRRRALARRAPRPRHGRPIRLPAPHGALDRAPARRGRDLHAEALREPRRPGSDVNLDGRAEPLATRFAPLERELRGFRLAESTAATSSPGTPARSAPDPP